MKSHHTPHFNNDTTYLGVPPTTSHNRNKNCVSPILRRVFSRPNILHRQPSSPLLSSSSMSSKVSSTGGRPESRMSANSNDGLEIDVLIEEAVQFMDEPLRGKLQLKGLVAPVEQVTISLTGVVKTHNAGSAGWASGFGGESNVNMRFSEREILKQEMVLHPIAQPASPLPPGRHHSLPFVFLFPANAKLPPSMIFPQGTGSVEYSLNVVLKGKKKFGSAKKWTHSLLLKVEISRKDVGAKLEVMGIADTTIPNSKQVVMLEHPTVVLPGYANHYFTLHFPQGLLQVQSFSATLLQRSIYKAVGGNQRGASMIGLVCQVGTPETNVREPGMERIHIEVLEVAEEGVESSVDVAGIIDRKHVLRIEVVVVLFKRGVEKIFFEIPVMVQCAAVPASHVDRRGTMSSMTSNSSSYARYPITLDTASLAGSSSPQTNLRASRSLGHFPYPPARNSLSPPNTFDASPPESPTAPSHNIQANLGRTRMNSKTWKEDELPGLQVSVPTITTTIPPTTPGLASPVKLDTKRSRTTHRKGGKNWTLVKPGLAALDSLAAPTPPPTCPIPEPPLGSSSVVVSVAPVIPPRSSSRLAISRAQAAPPTQISRSSSEDSSSSVSSSMSGRRGSQDTMTTASVSSSPSEYSGRSTAATSVSSSPSEIGTAPLKTRTTGGLSLRKVEEIGSGEGLRDGFDAKFFRTTMSADNERTEFQRRIDLALSEVEKLALEESDGEEDEEDSKDDGSDTGSVVRVSAVVPLVVTTS